MLKCGYCLVLFILVTKELNNTKWFIPFIAKKVGIADKSP